MGRLNDDEIRCRLLWRLVREHGWSKWVPEDSLVNRALPDSEIGRGREVCEALRSEPYLVWQHERGYRIKGLPEQETLARELRDRCDFTELQISSSLSHFDGFE
jgi:hypothetical protein